MPDLTDILPRASASFRKANPHLFAPAGGAPSAETLASIPKRITHAAPPPPKPKRRRVERTRNGGTMTEAAYWGMVRSGLRRTFRFWRPALVALRAARTASEGPHGRRWLYLCADCQRLYPRKCVQIDHVDPVGTLLDYEHVGEFLRRLTPEDPAAFAVRCKACHQRKTNKERNPWAPP